jgi:hypothetical protein
MRFLKSFFPSRADQAINLLSGGKLMPTFWCRIGIHTWDRWEVKKAATFNSSGMRFEELRRECRFCGYPELRQVDEVREQ